MIPSSEEMPFRLVHGGRNEETDPHQRRNADRSRLHDSKRSTAEGDCHSRAKSTEPGGIGMDQEIFENH